MRRWTFSIASIALIAMSGCLGITASADGGSLKPFTSRDGHTGGQANLRAGVFGSDQNPRLGGEMTLRAKLASNVKQFSIGGGVVFWPLRQHLVTPYGRLGLNEFQFESVEDNFGFGMFSPYGEAGLMVRVKPQVSISLGGTAEYDLRFTGADSEGYWGVLVGIVMVQPLPDPVLYGNPCGAPNRLPMADPCGSE